MEEEKKKWKESVGFDFPDYLPRLRPTGNANSMWHNNDYGTTKYQEILIKQIKQCIEENRPIYTIFAGSKFEARDGIWSLRKGIIGVFTSIFTEVKDEPEPSKDQVEHMRNNFIDFMQGLVLPWFQSWMNALNDKEGGVPLYLKTNRTYEITIFHALYDAFFDVSKKIIENGYYLSLYSESIQKKLDKDHGKHDELFKFDADSRNLMRNSKTSNTALFEVLEACQSLLESEADLYMVTKADDGEDEEPNKKQKTATCMRCGVYIKE